MIKANELRVGNWVYPNEENATPYPVLEIYEDSFLAHHAEFVYQDDVIIKLHTAEPIPLTPEILLACGFELQPQRQSIYIKGRTKLWMGHNGCIAYFKHQDLDESYWIGDCTSLHQLQNLYFALTGEELIYTPPSIKTI